VLYVVAWPLLSEDDDAALRRLRRQYHPEQAGLIGPHFTLVFGAPAEREEALRTALSAVRQRPFWFMIDRIVRHDEDRQSLLFAVPAEGAAELTALYEALNPESREFEPHITLGVFVDALDAEKIARIVERHHLPMHGRIEQLALLRRDGDKLATLADVRLER